MEKLFITWETLAKSFAVKWMQDCQGKVYRGSAAIRFIYEAKSNVLPIKYFCYNSAVRCSVKLTIYIDCLDSVFIAYRIVEEKWRE
jgi:hypothetical protein